jgi:hypothetical protein
MLQTQAQQLIFAGECDAVSEVYITDGAVCAL